MQDVHGGDEVEVDFEGPDASSTGNILGEE